MQWVQLVIARRTVGRRGNPLCLEARVRLVSSLTGSQWIATGFQPSRCQGVVECSGRFGCITLFVITRKERSEGRGNPSWFPGWRAVMELAYLLTLIYRALQRHWLYKLTLQQIANNLFGQPFIDLTMAGHWLR